MAESGSTQRVKRQARVVLAVLIVLAFAAVVVAKAGLLPAAPPASGSAESTTQAPPGGAGPSASLADASVAYEEALTAGKPIYLLFHSLTCVPCVEISAVVDKVVPEFEGRIAFVNAITTEESSQRLAGKFRFQYIPQSFFVDSKGSVVASFTGVVDEASMRARLDELASR